ncbi:MULTISPECIES: GNAT family N-acetyltransferase [Brevibacterium]|uniref:GNAT family N-acetyltransferase n=1 Tax=Brevibacterium casei TaxID=33889 RepID=A0A7T4DI34_9MICO|nr:MULTISPECIES: GNAT family N-acetyltransferase [Brevibacterium]QQB14092.1 GNAT family N-acetyltransferase [Brevibacterium casei]
MTNYRFESFTPAFDESTGEPDARTKGYFASTSVGFHDSRSTDAALKARVQRAIDDDRRLTAVYADNEYDYALDADIPVATFAWFEKLVNVGAGRLVPAHLITWVTVRPTHRRRGLLRSMITTDLAEAKAAGYPFAALTATEGGIYSRYGFGVATWSHAIEVDTSPGFQMIREPDRRVEMCLPSVLRELAPKIYGEFMKTSPGAMERQQTYVERATGALNTETGEADRGVRAALHFGEDGEPDGYVSYKFAGWSTTPPTIELIDFVAVTDAAYASLWSFLAAIDLSTRVKFGESAEDSPLPWLLTDSRRVKTTSTEDNIWIRILDVRAALEARAWFVPGTLVLDIDDPQELTGGRFRVTSDGQSAVVEPVSEATPADLSLGIAELGSLYFGGADPVILVRAGRIEENVPGAAVQAKSMFGLERMPYSPNGF